MSKLKPGYLYHVLGTPHKVISEIWVDPKAIFTLVSSMILILLNTIYMR